MLDAAGQAIQHPADQPCLAQLAACAALCNDSSLFFSAGARAPCSAPPAASSFAPQPAAVKGSRSATACDRIAPRLASGSRKAWRA